MIGLTCVTDNNVKPGSPFHREHGLCLRVEAPAGYFFFDTGASPATLGHNLDQLPPPAGPSWGVALSHTHYDHTGGLPALLARYPGLSVVASPFLKRVSFV